jgi:hypothetical protein
MFLQYRSRELSYNHSVLFVNGFSVTRNKNIRLFVRNYLLYLPYSQDMLVEDAAHSQYPVHLAHMLLTGAQESCS